MHIVAGVDLGGTAINYTLVDHDGRFLIDGLCEHPARAVEGPDVCLQQIVDGLNVAVPEAAGVTLDDIARVGLDTPGPASATGVLSARGSTNFVHPDWAGFDLADALSDRAGAASHLSQRRQRRRAVGTLRDLRQPSRRRRYRRSSAQAWRRRDRRRPVVKGAAGSAASWATC